MRKGSVLDIQHGDMSKIKELTPTSVLTLFLYKHRLVLIGENLPMNPPRPLQAWIEIYNFRLNPTGHFD